MDNLKDKVEALRLKYREIGDYIMEKMPLNPQELVEVSVEDSVEAFLLKKDLFAGIRKLIEFASQVDEDDADPAWSKQCVDALRALQMEFKPKFEEIGAKLPEFFQLEDYVDIMLYADTEGFMDFFEKRRELFNQALESDVSSVIEEEFDEEPIDSPKHWYLS